MDRVSYQLLITCFQNSISPNIIEFRHCSMLVHDQTETVTRHFCNENIMSEDTMNLDAKKTPKILLIGYTSLQIVKSRFNVKQRRVLLTFTVVWEVF